MSCRVSAIIPPHILEHLIAHGNAHPGRCAANTRDLDRDIRAQTRRRRATALPAPYKQPSAGLQRYVFDAGNQMTLPGDLVREEGQIDAGDTQVNEAYADLGATYRFYAEVFTRNSIDDNGLPLAGSVHYGQDYQNAFWNGEQMVFGDGDGEIFLAFTRALDVVAHELTHGVTEATTGLVYQDQPGALNESVSDVFGSMTAQYAAGQSSAEADWLIGARLLAPGVQGQGLRSLAAPGTAYDDPALGRDPQPATMAGYINTQSDNGGVHLNSGIPNHAFYLAAVALGGNSWDQAGPVWYDTLLDSRLAPDADFAAFADLTVDNAAARFDEDVTAAVRNSWREVGVDVA